MRGLPGGQGPIAAVPTADPDRIAFEVDVLGAPAAGHLQVRGRWFGVRGRRFVRPALILTATDGTERRLLAELDDKPWAAHDGEPWTATFLLDGELDTATALELSVAPDITVPLRDSAESDGRRVRRERGPVPATSPAAPRARADVPVRRPASRVQDTERLTTRLAAVEAALERERERRGEAETALEHQRAEARRLSAELGRAQADLELARTAEREAADTTALLDAARRDGHATRARYEALAADHERTVRAEAELQEELRTRDAELQAARAQLIEARHEHDEHTRHPVEDDVTAVHPVPVTAPQPLHVPAPTRSDRPVNPSLRHHSWFARFLVLLIIAAFLLAIYFVLHSTVLSN